MDTVKKLVRNVKEVAMDYDDVQLRVRDATSNDPVGADERLLARIAHDTRDRSSYNSMFSILWKRITDLHQPSHILKSLILTEYLLVHGDDRFVRDMRTKKNVVKRLTGYKFYRNHEDVGGEVRNQARTVLELLVNEDALENTRKDRSTGVIKTDRSNNPQIKFDDEFSDNSQLDSPQQRHGRLKEPSLSFSNSALDTPSNYGATRDSSSRPKTTKKYNSELTSTQTTKKTKKSKKKKDAKEKQNSFESSLSDEDDVERVTKAVAQMTTKTKHTEIDLITNQGAAPVDWFSNMNFCIPTDSQQQMPTASFESRGQVFQGTPIDPADQGSPEQDGFAFDDALEIGSDDDNDKGFWNVDKKLVDLSDLNAHGPPKKQLVVTGSAPGKTLAEIAAANRAPASSGNFAIHPLAGQAAPQQQFGQHQQFGYAQDRPNQYVQYGGFNQAMPASMYQQQMPYNGQMGMGYVQNGNMYPASGNQFMQAPFMNQAQMAPQQMDLFQKPSPATTNPYPKPNAAADPFAALWKP